MNSRPWPLEDADYDVVVVGGGMAGAGGARDLALRGGPGARGRSRERYRVLPPVDAPSLESAIRAGDLRGAGYYFDDLLVFPERLCLENVLSACRHGARAFNYARIEEIVRDARGVIRGVKVR